MATEVLAVFLCMCLGASAPLAGSVQAFDSTKPLVIFVDMTPKGLIYQVDGSAVSLGQMKSALQRRRDKSKPPDQQRGVLIIVHEDVTLSRVDELRRIVLATPFEPARVFYFDEVRRLMIEITYSNSMAFSSTGPKEEKH